MTDHPSPSSFPVAVREGSVFLAGQLSNLLCKILNDVDSIGLLLTLKNNILILFNYTQAKFYLNTCNISCPIIKKKSKILFSQPHL